MNDDKIIIELKPVIYAHHHGYRVVAKAHNISQQIVDALVASNHHLYFTNRKLDEQFRPLKFRFFSLEVGEQREKCYVLARLEPRQDVITHRGLVSATQFYVIDSDNCKIFENELQSNAVLLMAKIPFLNFNLDKLPRNEVANLTPTRLELDADAPNKQLQELPSNPILPRLQALFTEETIEAIEKRQKIFVRSKDFSDPIAIFNLYCRTFFTAQLEYYRKNSAFSTAELSTEILDYDLVFLLATVGDKMTNKSTNIKIISLDSSESGRNALWYLGEEKLPEYYRLLSERIVKPSFTAIQNLKGYCDFLLNRKESVAIRDFNDQVAGLLNFVDALNRIALGNDFLNMLPFFKSSSKLLETMRSAGIADDASQKLVTLKGQAWQGKQDFLQNIENVIGQAQTQKWRDVILKSSIELEWEDTKNQRSRTEVLQNLFASLFKIFSDSTPRPEWPAEILEPFVQLVLDWFGFLLKRSGDITWPGFSESFIKAIKDLAPAASNVKEKILRRMLDERTGLGCVPDEPDEKKVIQAGLIFDIWSSLLDACTKVNPVPLSRDLVYERIWQQQIQEIIAKIDLERIDERAFSKPLRTLCRQLNDLYVEKDRNKTLFYEMWHAMEVKPLEVTARLFFLEIYANNEFTPNDYKSVFENSSSRLQTFIDRIMRALMETSHKSLEIRDRQHEEFAFKFVRQLSFLAKQPLRLESRAQAQEIQSLVRDNFIFTGKYFMLRLEQHFRFWQTVEDAVATGLEKNRSYLAFTDEIFIQAELLMNLNLLENRDYRRLRVNGFFFALEMPQFASRFEKLAPDVRMAFFNNLCGFIDAAENIQSLKHSILPTLWSYLSRIPQGNDLNADRCFQKMMQFIVNNTSGFIVSFPVLCKEIESIPCNSTPLQLSFDEINNRIFIRKCDYRHYLLQLATATQNRRARIQMLLNFLVTLVGPAEVEGHIKELIEKYYLPSRLSDPFGEIRNSWESEFNRLSKR